MSLVSSSQALTCFRQLQVTKCGWQAAARKITTPTTGLALSDNVKFFALQVVEAYVREAYETCEPVDKELMHNFATQWFQQQVCCHILASNHLSNVPFNEFLTNQSSRIHRLCRIMLLLATNLPKSSVLYSLLITRVIGPTASQNLTRPSHLDHDLWICTSECFQPLTAK